MPDDKKNTLKSLKAIRKANGFTQKQVADLLGIDRSTYAYYETGKSKPNIVVIDKLIKIFKVDYNVLLGTEESVEQPVLNDVNRQGSENYMIDLNDEERELISRFRIMKRKQKDSLLEQLGISGDSKKKPEKNKTE